MDECAVCATLLLKELLVRTGIRQFFNPKLVEILARGLLWTNVQSAQPYY